MTQEYRQEITAGEIRVYCIETYIEPARTKGEKQVTIRVGDVHKALELKGRFGSVYGAIGAGIFQREARVGEPQIKGPNNAPSAEFTFEILP